MDGVSGRNLSQDAGRLLRTLRERRGLSQARLAARVGASQQWLSQLERGARNATLADLERFFGGLGSRLRFEVVPTHAAAAEDPELLLDAGEQQRAEQFIGYDYLLDKLYDLPYLVGGRVAALAHGLPVRVRRLDLIVADRDRPRLAEAVRRFSSVRWSERWQEFCDYLPPEQPGPMRWLIGGSWELRATLVAEPPGPVAIRLWDRQFPVPPLPWLLMNDPDVADLLERLRAAGWQPAHLAAGPAPA